MDAPVFRAKSFRRPNFEIRNFVTGNTAARANFAYLHDQTHGTVHHLGRPSMRTVLILACAAVLIFSAWSNMPTTADAKQTGNSTVGPVTTISNVPSLPNQDFDAF
jgi:hypothetical protein